ncbi:MAG: response regulator, partial [Candidatus Latescibacteria bacterium]|nr:response regulator [Candidatus Latescibacterota bacterium]
MAKARIMVVEDEALVALDLTAKLRQLDYEVPGGAFTGEEAVQQAEALLPDLVLMDIR